MINKVEIQGHLMRDPGFDEVRDNRVASAQLVLNGTRWDPEVEDHVVTQTFAVVEFWGPVAEEFEGYGLQQGDEIYVVGHLGQKQRRDRDQPSTRVYAVMFSVVRRKAASHRPAQERPF